MPAAVRAVIFFVPPVTFWVRPVVLAAEGWAAMRPVPRSTRSVLGGAAAIRPVLPLAGATAGGTAATRRLVLPCAGAAAGGATLTATRAVFSPAETEKVNRSLPT